MNEVLWRAAGHPCFRQREFVSFRMSVGVMYEALRPSEPRTSGHWHRIGEKAVLITEDIVQHIVHVFLQSLLVPLGIHTQAQNKKIKISNI